MKKNKILAGLSALVMGATMMAGTAMSASAAGVYTDPDDPTTYVGDGGFWAYYTSTGSWAAAPHGMYDGNIDGDVVDNGDNTVTFDLMKTDYTVTYTVNGITYTTTVYDGYIYSITDSNGVEMTSGIDVTNGVIPSSVTLTKGTVYTLVVKTLNSTTTLADDPVMHTSSGGTMPIKFVVS